MKDIVSNNYELRKSGQYFEVPEGQSDPVEYIGPHDSTNAGTWFPKAVKDAMDETIRISPLLEKAKEDIKQLTSQMQAAERIIHEYMRSNPRERNPNTPQYHKPI